MKQEPRGRGGGHAHYAITIVVGLSLKLNAKVCAFQWFNEKIPFWTPLFAFVLFNIMYHIMEHVEQNINDPFDILLTRGRETHIVQMKKGKCHKCPDNRYSKMIEPQLSTQLPTLTSIVQHFHFHFHILLNMSLTFTTPENHSAATC